MIRQIDVGGQYNEDPSGEGLCYELDKAMEEGLYEEMIVHVSRDARMYYKPIPVTPELMDAILDATELGVNVPPGDPQTIYLAVIYAYDYGREEVPTP